MTVGELIKALDDYGSHLEVVIEDAKERRYPVTQVSDSADRQDHMPIVVLSYE